MFAPKLRILLLDTPGTEWNDGGPASFVTAPYSIDAVATFNAEEKQAMVSIWRAVSEDYAVFDVDVTTEDPGLAGITRSSTTDTNYGVRVVIGGKCSDWLNPGVSNCGSAGIAYVNVFGSTFFG
jgi:hypothetical protein